ncbi:MAG: FAD-binding oxidoreductase [Bacteroidetes bacterium]|nr:MAG: FAD-binding oxidoreductase [Bacteroidota bacterium]
MRRIWKYITLLGIIIIAVPIVHLLSTRLSEVEVNEKIVKGHTNDESHLNLTLVDSIIPVEQTRETLIKQLRSVLKYAQENNLKISIAGARHSMGGHTISPKGIILFMRPFKGIQLDSTQQSIHVEAGALWSEVLRFLDPFGKSVPVMQAFSSFSIGGSLSVNGHGWQRDVPPISHSVKSIDLMLADGSIVHCSRIENPELFKCALGGYGLFGIILSAEITVVDNTVYTTHSEVISSEDYPNLYKNLVSSDPRVEMAYGRLRISEKNFLEESTLVYFKRSDVAVIPPLSDHSNSSELKRTVFRGSVDSEYGKRLRWDLESVANSLSRGNIISRNELLDDDVSVIKNLDTTTTDILHEYFIPVENFNTYLNDVKIALQASEIDLLNITIRAVDTDTTTFLSYAREPMFGFVFLFNYPRTNEADNEMKALTQELIDIALKYRGTYYLPYRLHATKQQFNSAYPMADSLFRLKLKYDKNERFSNIFYQTYR